MERDFTGESSSCSIHRDITAEIGGKNEKFKDSQTNSSTVPFKGNMVESVRLIHSLLEGENAEKAIFKFKTCSETGTVDIIILPDIKYTFKIGFGMGLGKNDNKLKDDGTLEISSDYNNQEIPLGLKFPVDKFTNLVTKFVKTLAKIAKFENSLSKLVGDGVPIGRYALIKLDTPTIKFYVSWQYDVSDDHQKLGGLYTIGFSADPLIGGTLVLKLLDLAIAAAGQASMGLALAGPAALIPLAIKLAKWTLEVAKKAKIG
jgi:hypothetical protein